MRSKQFSTLVTILVVSLVTLPAAMAQTGDPAPPPAAEPAPTADGGDPPLGAAAQPAGAPPVATPAGAAADTASAVRDAVGTSADSLERGADGLAEQGSRMWDQVLLPMWQRIATAFPSLVKALLLLLAFWLAALILSAAVRKLLQMTKLDERAAKDWGLAGLLESKDGKPRSPASIGGQVTFWFVMLFGLVAFFQALDLAMVAEPLQNVADGIVGVVPNVLAALVILLAYWIIATLVRLGLTKVLTAARFDERAGRYWASREVAGETVGPTALLSRLAFYFILLFGLPPFLEALGQTALVAPLTEMLGEAFAFLPNLVAALVLFLLGKMVATIVREVVTHFLAAAGADKSAERLGASAALGSRKVSDVAGAFAYFFILIAVFVAAVDSLGIAAVSEPVSATLERLLTAVPLVLVALVVVAIGWMVARAVRDLVATFLEGVGFDQLPERFGLGFMKTGKGPASLSSIAATVVMTIILLLTAEQALASLGLSELGAMVGALIAYLPRLLTGLAILLVAIAVGGLVGRLTEQALAGTAQRRIAAPVARYAVIFLGGSMALSQLGVGDDVVVVVVSAVLFGTALALGLAFGLGGREKAKELIERIDA